MGSGIRKTLKFTEFKKVPIIFPSMKEQELIVAYLDDKCSKIDRTISNLEKLIAEEQEYKKSLITQVVTKGLDPNVEMKDSGVEWIGKIPAIWKVEPLYLHFRNGKEKNTGLICTDLLSLSYGKIVDKDISSNNGLLPESFETYNIVNKGDIIIRPTDLQNDKKSLRTGLVPHKGIITSAYLDLQPINLEDIITTYMHYLLHCYDVEKVFYNMGSGVRQGLTFDVFKKLPILIPEVQEQKMISRFLDTQCSKIDRTISNL